MKADGRLKIIAIVLLLLLPIILVLYVNTFVIMKVIYGGWSGWFIFFVGMCSFLICNFMKSFCMALIKSLTNSDQ
ncbi:hypothetical protein O23A_P3p0060 (plasmid) [Aeromonas salmonicida]|nr:hypothetical protein O23A_P3p0060 [Aeromonas salmonicida]